MPNENEPHDDSGSGRHSLHSTTEQDFLIPPAVVSRQASQYANPNEAQKWLLSFGSFKTGTTVSLRFKIPEGDHRAEKPHTLVPLFTSWMNIWYESASKDSHMHANLVWLLRYIRDYIGLGHAYLDQDEMVQLCKNVIELCEKTTKEEELLACLDVLTAVAGSGYFPEQCLDTGLRMLCHAIVSLKSVTGRTNDCVRSLVRSSQGSRTIELLEGLMHEPISSDADGTIADHMRMVRGAPRYLSHLLEIESLIPEVNLKLEDILDAAEASTTLGYVRLATEVLDLCLVMVHARGKEVIEAPLLLNKLLRIMDLCMNIQFSSDTSEGSQKREERFLRERGASFSNLANEIYGHISTMTNEQKRQFALLLWDKLIDVTSSPLDWMMTYAEEEKLCSLGDASREKRLQLMTEEIIMKPTMPSSIRIQAIRVCTEALLSSTAHPEETHVKSNGMSTMAIVFQHLVSLVHSEINTSVLRALLTGLQKLSECRNDEGLSNRAPVIISALSDHVTGNDVEENISDEHFLLCTQALRQIFLTSIANDQSTANFAFEALLKIADPFCKSRRSRLASMRILFRIRCDVDGLVYIDTSSSSMELAAALCRTQESFHAYNYEHPMEQRHASVSSSSGTTNELKNLWMYPQEQDLVGQWSLPSKPVLSIRDFSVPTDNNSRLKILDWLFVIIKCLQADKDWDIYSYVLIHLGSQLVNMRLFSSSLEAIVQLRKVTCDQVRSGQFHEPSVESGLRKSDVALCIYDILHRLVPYAKIESPHIQIEGFGNDLVRAFIAGIAGQWDATARCCIRALSVCCFETPKSIASEYPSIVLKMSKSMSQSHLVVHILEFLAQVARLPELHSNFNDDEIRIIFGMCIQFLEKSREKYNVSDTITQRTGTPGRHSGLSLKRPPFRAAILQEKGLPQYASALAYHTMIFWFLSLNLTQRAPYVTFIVPRLIWKNTKGDDTVDEQSEVLIDMMQRTAFSDLGETSSISSCASSEDGPIASRSWIHGLSVMTVETAGNTGKTQIIKRQACGTTHAIYQQSTSALPTHHIPRVGDAHPISVLPPHVMLQMVATAAATNVSELPIPLPRGEDFVTRGLNGIDRIATVDSHKIGVLLINDNQTAESQYLANNGGSAAFKGFLGRLGTVVSLEKPAHFNAHGLQHEIDGTETIAWRDRVNEIVYCVPALMPNRDEDPNMIAKKAHIGNCFVVIVFNQSNVQWKMENFPSQVTSVHIVINPVDRQSSSATYDNDAADFYRVETLVKREYDGMSGAGETVVLSKATLAPFVRLLALNANIFSQTHRAVSGGDDEFPSSWRARLQAIKRLRQQVLARTMQQPEDTLTMRLNFGRWA